MRNKAVITIVALLSLLTTLTISASVPTDRMFLGIYDPSGAYADKAMDVELGFLNWADKYSIQTFMTGAQDRGRTPIVSVEPWATTGKNVLLDTTSGANDPYLDNLVEAFNSFDGEFWVRWAQEPELTNLYPWGQGMPERYIYAFRYVETYLKANVTKPERMTFVFAPAGDKNGTYYYPGDTYVDKISLTILSDTIWDTKLLGNEKPIEFRAFLEGKYLHYVQFQKPIYVGELGVSRETEEERQAWLDKAMVELQSGNWPWLEGIVYFNAQNAANIWTEYLPYWTLGDKFWTPDQMPLINYEGRNK